MALFIVERVGTGFSIRPGENTLQAAASALVAEGWADAAALSAATAEAAAGPTYASTAAGLAATTSGEAFAVDAGGGLVSVYLNSSGTAVLQRTLATTGALAASGGAGLVGFIQSGTGATARTVQSKLRDTVSVKDFGAVGDGVTDDTAAITAADIFAAALGKKLIFPDGHTFMASHLTATTSWIGGGTIKRLAGSTGDFIAIGAADVLLDVVIDADGIGTANDRIVYNVYDGFQTAPTFIAKNGPHNGVESRNASNVKIRGTILDCVQSHLFVMSDSAAITGLLIDVDVDGTTIGLGNLNGGVKIHAKNGFDIKAPVVNARVRLLESASMALNAVCLELLGFSTLISGTTYTGPATVIKNARIQGTVSGGSIGCTLGGCDDTPATIIATGQNHLGLEVNAGCKRSGYTSGSSVSAGPAGIGPKNGGTITGSCEDCYHRADISGVTNAVDAQAASFYVNGSPRSTLSGSAHQAAGLHYIRNIDSPNLTFENIRLRGSVTRMLTLTNSIGNCDGLRGINIDAGGCGSIIQCPGAQDGARFYNCRFDNSSATLVSGSPPSFTSGQFINCEFTSQPFGSGAKNINVYDYVPGGASLITLVRTGSPEGYITAKAGSTCLRDDGGAGTSLYVKQSATGSSGWAAK